MATKEVLSGRFDHLGSVSSKFKGGQSEQPGDGKGGPAEYALAKKGGNRAPQLKKKLMGASPKFFDAAADRRSLKNNASSKDSGYTTAHV